MYLKNSSRTIHLQAKLDKIPASLSKHGLKLSESGDALVYTYDTAAGRTGITGLLGDLSDAKIRFNDIDTQERSLEDIFVNLVHEDKEEDKDE